MRGLIDKEYSTVPVLSLKEMSSTERPKLTSLKESGGISQVVQPYFCSLGAAPERNSAVLRPNDIVVIVLCANDTKLVCAQLLL